MNVTSVVKLTLVTKDKSATAIVYVETTEFATIDTIISAAERKARENIAGFEDARSFNPVYVGSEETVVIVK